MAPFPYGAARLDASACFCSELLEVLHSDIFRLFAEDYSDYGYQKGKSHGSYVPRGPNSPNEARSEKTALVSGLVDTLREVSVVANTIRLGTMTSFWSNFCICRKIRK